MPRKDTFSVSCKTFPDGCLIFKRSILRLACFSEILFIGENNLFPSFLKEIILNNTRGTCLHFTQSISDVMKKEVEILGYKILKTFGL